MENKERSRDNRNIAICLLISLISLSAFFYRYNHQTGQSKTAVGKILRRTGEVQIKVERFQNWKDAGNGAPLYNKSAIYTLAQSEAHLLLHQAEIAVGEKTLLQIIEPERKNEVWMDFGSFTVSTKQKKDILLKVGGKMLRMDLEDGEVKVARNKEGLTEIQALKGNLIVEIDGIKQKVGVDSSLSLDLPGGNSEFSEEILAQERAQQKTIAVRSEARPAEPVLRLPALAASNPPPAPAPTPELLSVAMPPPEEPIVEAPVPIKKKRRKLNATSFQFGLGGNYISAKESSDLSNSELQGFSGPTVYFQVWHALSENLGLDAYFLAVRSRVSAALYGTNAVANVDWSSAALGLYSRKDSGFPLLRLGLHYQDIPLFFETDMNIVVDRANIYSLYIGYGGLKDVRQDLFFLWDAKLIVPLVSNNLGHIHSFNPGMGVEGSIGFYQCLSEKWSWGLNSMLQYQPATYSAPVDNSQALGSYHSELMNISNQVRFIYGACGTY